MFFDAQLGVVPVLVPLLCLSVRLQPIATPDGEAAVNASSLGSLDNPHSSSLLISYTQLRHSTLTSHHSITNPSKYQHAPLSNSHTNQHPQTLRQA